MEKRKGREGREISAADQIEEEAKESSNSSPLLWWFCPPRPSYSIKPSSSQIEMASILSVLSVQVVQFWQTEQMSLDLREHDMTVDCFWKWPLAMVEKFSFELKTPSNIANSPIDPRPS